jgi:small ligand-binding sensory domain FIST
LSGLPLAGGLAIGGQGSGSTRLLIDGRVVDRGAVGIVIGGGVEVSAFVSQGCRPVGNPMTITKCEGNVLLELAGRPALQRLEDLLLMLSPEDQAIATTGLTIGVARDEYRDEMVQGDFIVRNLVRIDRERKALVVADLFELGQTVQFQLRDAAAATSDLDAVIARWRAREEVSQPSGALLFSCNGRGEHFFSTSDHDVLAVSDGLDGVDVAGYFAAGEIGPIAGRNYLHGFSASIVAFGGDQPRGRAAPGAGVSTD